MAKGQLRLGMLLLGLVAIVALVGLTLLFFSPGATFLGIGDSYKAYDRGDRGIESTYKTQPFKYGRYNAPTQQWPVYGSTTIGTRTPIMIFFKGEYGNLVESSRCWADLFPILPSPKNLFSCYVISTMGPAYEVTGHFPPTSSALPRAPSGAYQLGGQINCYLRTPLDREAMIDKLKPALLPKGWVMDKVNGQDVLSCQKGKYFIYPQGVRYE